MLAGVFIGDGYGVPIGLIFGSAYGVYAVGNIGNQTGSFKATLGGSFLGFLGGVGAAACLAELYDTNQFFPAQGYCLLAGPPIGATIGFNLTRRYKSPPASKTALINIRDGQMNLEVSNSCIASFVSYYNKPQFYMCIQYYLEDSGKE